MNSIEQFLAGILNPGGRGSMANNPRLEQIMPGGNNALSGMRAPQPAQEPPVQAFQAQQAPSQPQAAPAPPQGGQQPQQRSGGGIGDFLGNIIAPQRAAKNETVGWLQQQGLDEGTATLLAGNKQALQQYLLDRSQGGQPEYDFMNIDGTLVRTDKRTGQAQPVGQFGAQEEPTTDDVREYQFAQKQGYEGSFTDFMQEMRQAGATNVTTNVGGEQTPGWRKIDEAFADTYLSWQSGGFADSVKMLDQLGEALGILESGQDVTGAIGLIPDVAQPFINEQGTVAKEAVEEVVQRNLREILGAQFTEKEGERLISRAYNPRLRPEENAKRVRRLIGQVADMAKSKQAMVDYFDQNGTLRGYTGPRPSKSDLDNIDFGDEGSPAANPRSAREGGGLGAPSPGTVEDGYRFKGGDPGDPANWERAN